MKGNFCKSQVPKKFMKAQQIGFVADFIGRTNLLDGTTADNETVVLSNGTSIRAQNTFLSRNQSINQY